MSKTEILNYVWAKMLKLEPQATRTWNSSKAVYVNTGNYGRDEIVLDGEIMRSLKAIQDKLPDIEVASFKLPPKDAAKVLEEVENSCLSEKAKKAITAAVKLK